MPIDAPTFPGEREVPLAGVTITSAFCTNPANVFDDDPRTAGTFAGYSLNIGTPISLTVLGVQSTWLDTGLVLAPGTGFIGTASGTYTWNPSGGVNGGIANCGGLPPTPGGPFNSTLAAAPYGSGAGINGLAMVFIAIPDGTVPLKPLSGGFHGTGSGQYDTPFTFGFPVTTNPLDASPQTIIVSAAQIAAAVPSGNARIFVIFNDGYLPDNSGSLSLSIASIAALVNPVARFVRADWGAIDGDQFVCRVRLRMAGAGNGNAAIALESSLGAGHPDIPLAYIPLPSDEMPGVSPVDGSGVHELTFDPPLLACGVTFYPDYLAGGTGSTGTVSLYQLQAYAVSGVPIMPNTQPTQTWSQVGAQAILLYPYLGVTGPYDATTIAPLGALQSFAIGEGSTSAIIEGGETVFALGAFETKRELKFKAMVQQCSLKALLVLQGGRLVVDPANSNGGEVQYHAPNKSDRAPYFRLNVVSTNGDGTLTVGLLKCKITGAINYNLDKSKATDLEFEFMAFWDNTYVCQDGTVGGIREMLHGQNGETVMHS